jgi:hypothetical protein
MKSIILGLLFLSATVMAKKHDCMEHGSAAEKSFLNHPNKWYQISLGFESGFTSVISHTIQFDSNGTKFDYVDEGGQNILFPFTRFTAEIKMHQRHNLIFLYQPLDIKTEALLRNDLIVDELVFPADTPMKLHYGFSFWRFSYLYDFNKDKNKEIAIGLSLQIRNASISFASYDGSLFRVNQGVGLVPIIKLRTRFPFKNGMWLGSEIDGFYASGKYITGGKKDFLGAILDASLRLGYKLNNSLDSYINIRYLGGGARGAEDSPGPGDGYTDNWLHTMVLSLGFYFK